MKRNKAPLDGDELVEEGRIIENRLENLFSVAEAERQICASSKGYWLADKRHVRVESAKSAVAAHLLCYSTELKYHYLDPLQALYCLEGGQLLVFHRGLPLSLVEAYELLIADQHQFTEYLVLQRLFRSGYICLRPPPATATVEGQPPLAVISFEVYRKETYSNRKPQRKPSNRRGPDRSQQSSEGRPDYLIVSVRLSCGDQMLSMKQLLYLDELRSKRGIAAVVADAAAARITPTSMAEPACDDLMKPEIIFALVDDDYSVCFTRCAPMAMTFN